MKTLYLTKPQTITEHVFNQPIVIQHKGVKLVNCRSEGVKNNKPWYPISVEIAVNDYKLENFHCNNVGHGFVLDGKRNKLIGCSVKNYRGDGIRFAKNGARIIDNEVTDYIGKDTAHVDCLQGWSGDQSTHYSNKDRFKAIHILRDCHIKWNRFMDDSKVVQAFLISDGLLSGFRIENNFIMTPNSPHSISIRGMHGPEKSTVKNNCITGARMRIQNVRRVNKERLKELGPLNVEISNNWDLEMNELIPLMRG